LKKRTKTEDEGILNESSLLFLMGQGFLLNIVFFQNRKYFFKYLAIF
jgi:hypothetical protein